MIEFKLWFLTGVEHIIDLNGYDHILFVVLLVISSNHKEWRKLLLLISAFTIGHTLSLALSVSNLVNFNRTYIEFFIGISILITALYQLKSYKTLLSHQNIKLLICIIIFFGLIHGLGFSYLLKSMLSKQDSIVLPLIYFNLGIEFGQLVIVLLVLFFSLILENLLKDYYKFYKLILLCFILLISLKITLERLLALLYS